VVLIAGQDLHAEFGIELGEVPRSRVEHADVARVEQAQVILVAVVEVDGLLARQSVYERHRLDAGW
jgi:hypothetical protein